MKRHLLATIVLSLFTSASAWATPTIFVGVHPNILYGVPDAELDLYVTGLGPGVNSITGLDFFFSIASEQDVAPAGEPKIAGIDLVTGTIFEGNTDTPAPGQILFQSDQVWEIDAVVHTGALTQDGKIATIFLDTTGVHDYTVWGLNVFNVQGQYNANYANAFGINLQFQGSNGSFVSVPEPTSVVTMSIAALMLLPLFRRVRNRPTN